HIPAASEDGFYPEAGIPPDLRDLRLLYPESVISTGSRHHPPIHQNNPSEKYGSIWTYNDFRCIIYHV
ncbi:MAG: hypothetical protein K6A45_00800, partial [Lachnospiraceae bacterium]|nr:hypothetical protein [Lachnospiraceae bacterium]